MGFIDNFKANLENFANANFTNRQGKTGDGKIDLYEKASLFNNPELLNELKSECERDQSVQQQVQSDLGMSLSLIKSRIEQLSGEHKGARRAPGAEGGNDNGNGDENGLTINITFNNNWYINITVQNDTREMLEALLKAFTENMQTISQDLFNQFKEYLNSEGDKFKEFLVGLFQTLYNDNGTSIEVLQNILAQLQAMGLNVANIDNAIQDMLKVQVELLKTENYNAQNIDKLVALVTENNEETKKQNEMLGLIYDALINLSDEQKQYFNAILAKMDDSKESYNQMVALLQAIKDANDENSTKLLKLVSENNDLSKQILVTLESINAKIDAYGDEFNEFKALLKQIAEKELIVNVETGDININIDDVLAKLDAMMQTLQSIDDNTGKTANYTKQILDAVNKLGVDVTGKLDEILAKMGTDSVKLDSIIEILKQMDEHNTEQNKALLDAINKLGVDITEALKNIVVKLDPTQLDTLVDLLNKLDANNTEQNKAILEAINGLGLDAKAILQAIKNLNVGGSGSTDLSEVIDAIKANGGNISSILNKIFTLLTTINGNVLKGNTDNATFFDKILSAIANLGNEIGGNGDPVDLSLIETILEEILIKIQNHKVDIYVHTDADGTIHCTTDEGEHNDWDNVLNARAISDIDIQDNEDGINELKPGEAYIPDGSGKVGKKILDPRYGVIIVDTSNPGVAYLPNGTQIRR